VARVQFAEVRQRHASFLGATAALAPVKARLWRSTKVHETVNAQARVFILICERI